MEPHSLVRIYNRPSANSPFWWEGVPASYPLFKARMLRTYPEAHACIDRLLPVGFASGDAGIGGATLRLGTVVTWLSSNTQHWARRSRQWNRQADPAPVHRILYETTLRDSAELLFGAWQGSRAARGWLAVELEPSEMHSAQAMLRRARELAVLMPNIMVSVPASETGCQVIEELVAGGHAVNASLCFSVAQVQACLAAIRRGRQRALSQGVCLERTRHLISSMPAGFARHLEFSVQASQAGVEVSAMDWYWAEIALRQALCSAMAGQGERVRLMVSGLDIGQGGATGMLHSAGEPQFESVIAASGGQHAVTLQQELKVPGEVMERLLRIAAFRQAWGADDLPGAVFARHPAFLHAMGQGLRAYTRLMGFARQLNAPLEAEMQLPGTVRSASVQ